MQVMKAAVTSPRRSGGAIRFSSCWGAVSSGPAVVGRASV